MRDPTPEELEHLKAEFARLCPDAARAIRLPRGTRFGNAACQWMGFKIGYMLAKEEAEG